MVGSIDDATEEDWNNLARNNGGTTDYYTVPANAETLNDLIDHKEMSWNVGNIFKACYRLNEKHSIDAVYDLNKIIYYAQRELKKHQGR